MRVLIKDTPLIDWETDIEKEIEEKKPSTLGFEPTISLLRGVCFTAAQHGLEVDNFLKDEFEIVKIFLEKQFSPRWGFRPGFVYLVSFSNNLIYRCPRISKTSW